MKMEHHYNYCIILETLVWCFRVLYFLKITKHCCCSPRVKTYRQMDNKNHHTNILSPFPSPELHAVLPAMFVNFGNILQYNHAQMVLSKMYETSGSMAFSQEPARFVNKLVGQRDLNTCPTTWCTKNSHMTGIPWLFVIQVFPLCRCQVAWHKGSCSLCPAIE